MEQPLGAMPGSRYLLGQWPKRALFGLLSILTKIRQIGRLGLIDEAFVAHPGRMTAPSIRWAAAAAEGAAFHGRLNESA